MSAWKVHFVSDSSYVNFPHSMTPSQKSLQSSTVPMKVSFPCTRTLSVSEHAWPSRTGTKALSAAASAASAFSFLYASTSAWSFSLRTQWCVRYIDASSFPPQPGVPSLHGSLQPPGTSTPW